ncbi:hypothetical protein J7T55_012653 [Diaporthe amygdali]|uniref:uncharacterized protein n=1 Tax=Phomopsis amygdali TaxID=1214568 RepID=UPI0022FE1BDD|nr:uncharacterized protein J7T55_012653 [Diaporthe amygdali]KAJ0115374.1 hypothetical protein J7T55_012653 [Diaporthe amygdali]
MASNVRGTPAEGREERVKNVGKKLLLRMKTVLRKTEPAKRTETTHVPTASAPPQTEDGQAVFEGERIPRAQVYSERAQLLSERFGLDMDPHTWYPMEGHVLRVNKPIRMRVHRSCHQCGHGLNQSGICDSCKHTACSQCSYYPPKRSEAELEASREARDRILRERTANAMIVPDWNFNPNEKVVLRRPGKAGGQELVYKKVRQRVRRTCCQCLEFDGLDTSFQGGKLSCPKCNHARCTDCPRDPPKKDKYPYGYPGDEFGAKSIPHYKCHECYEKFPPGAQDGETCFRCAHEKCNDCQRLRPQKVEPKPDPEVLRSVQEKLAAMNLA